MNRKALAAFLLFALVQSGLASTQSTTFTYQGSLAADGHPANGQFDLTFTLYDAPTLGNAVGTPIVLSQVTVTNGVFAEDLDFGNAVTGQQLWLEVKVGSQTLTPRQAINAVPAAQYAQPVFIGSSSNVFVPTANQASVIPVSGSSEASNAVLVTLNPDQSFTVVAPGTAFPPDVQVMPTAGRLTRMYGNLVHASGPNSGSFKATLYLGQAGSTTLSPTSLVCNFTLTSNTASACSGSSSVEYSAGQTAAIVVTGSPAIPLMLVAISMAP